MTTDIGPTDVLDALNVKEGPILTAEAFPHVPFASVKRVLDTLGSRSMITYTQIDSDVYRLTDEAREILRLGSPEARVFEAVQAAIEGLSIKDLPVSRFVSWWLRLIIRPPSARKQLKSDKGML